MTIYEFKAGELKINDVEYLVKIAPNVKVEPREYKKGFKFEIPRSITWTIQLSHEQMAGFHRLFGIRYIPFRWIPGTNIKRICRK